MSTSIVLIGPASSLPALCERLDSGAELHTFTDLEALEALDHIIRIKPAIVALDKEFSSTSRGRALINRISDDPSLHASEIRVVGRDSAATRVMPRRPETSPGGSTAATEPRLAASVAAVASVTLDQRGTRRAPRFAVRDGIEILVDGNQATLVDMSTVGAQVVSVKPLRPNQRVRIALPEGAATTRCDGSIAWSAFEMPKGQPPRYRAGIEFTGADPRALAPFIERHKK